MSKSKLTAAVSALALSLSLISSAALACTSVLVTPGASVDGTASVTHTCDSGNSCFEIYKVPAQDWEPGSMMDVMDIPQYTNGHQNKDYSGVSTGNQIPQVEHTYGSVSYTHLVNLCRFTTFTLIRFCLMESCLHLNW